MRILVWFSYSACAIIIHSVADGITRVLSVMCSDVLVLQVIHSSVVDTAVVFPHRRGPPFKRSLKNLMAEHLHKFIQDNVGACALFMLSIFSCVPV